MFDVDVVASDRVSNVRTRDVRGEEEPAAPIAPPPAGTIGFLMPWGSGAASTRGRSAAAGHQGHDGGRRVHARGRKYPIGTAFVRLADNPGGAAATLQQIAQRHGAELVPIAETWTEEGISLGSGRTARLRAPRVLLAWDTPVATLSAGFARYVLEQRYGLRVTAMRTSTLQNYDMKDYDVLVLPSGNYTFSDDALRRLKDWVRNGGTLVTIAEASRWAARDRIGLLSTDTLLRDGSPERDAPEGAARGRRRRAAAAKPDLSKPFDFEKAIQPERERPENLAGAMLRVVLYPYHWLTAGLDGDVQTVYEGARVFAPLKLDAGVNVGTYAPIDRLVAARPGVEGGAAADRRARLPDAPAAGARPRDRVRGGPELPRLLGGDAAALHQRRPARRRALGDSA